MACFMTLGLFHKLADRKQCRPTHINIFLFGWSALIGLTALAVRGKAVIPPGGDWGQVWAIALPSGACAATAILLFQIGVRYGKIATSWLIVNLSGAVPILVSVVLYGEHVDLRKLIALAAMLASLILLWLEKRAQESGG